MDDFVELPALRFEDHDVRFLVTAQGEEWLRAEDACEYMAIAN